MQQPVEFLEHPIHEAQGDHERRDHQNAAKQIFPRMMQSEARRESRPARPLFFGEFVAGIEEDKRGVLDQQ